MKHSVVICVVVILLYLAWSRSFSCCLVDCVQASPISFDALFLETSATKEIGDVCSQAIV